MIFSKYIKTFICLLVIYTGLMFLTFLIPNFNLEKNINIAHQMYATDGPYPATIKGFPQTQIDNFTDLEIMAPRMLATDSAIHHAMDMDNYAR
ncbi:hypothetical protein DKR64_16380, partial [Salmonella enterica]|nr:hypothetical protein [Salmonella enterica]